MFKWVAAALAGLYCIFIVYGDPARIGDRPTMSGGTSPLTAFFAAEAEPVETTRLPRSTLSDGDAVDLAIAAGAALRADREAGSAPSLRGLVAAVETAAEAPFAHEAPPENIWFVTGTTVNLRSGPGTGNEVVARLTLGTEARPLSDPASDWIEIETTDGSVRGFIFSRFLSQSRPG